MWVFFPAGLFYILYKYLISRFKMNITSKTTLIFSVMFAVAFIAYSLFMLISVCGGIFSGEPLTETFAISLIVASVVFILLALVLFVALGTLTSRNMLSPVRKMINKIDEISADNLNARLDPVDSQDELTELTEQINIMLDSIENSFQQQIYFVSDASHELRTPISIIHGYAELLKRWGKGDPQILNEGLDAIYTESNNMKHIVEQLLYLTKIGSFNFSAAEFNLSAVICDIVSGYEMTHPDKIISVDVGESVPVVADKATVVELIRIITDNAIKYTRAGGRILIRCFKQNHNAVIKISDNGIGISEEDLPHIYDRFYRCDKSRGRETGSTGLGLAIAKSIIGMTGGSIHCQSELGKGTTFTITLPPAVTG